MLKFSRVPDEIEASEIHGAVICANTDRDAGANAPDKDTSPVSGDDDLAMMWWIYERPLPASDDKLVLDADSPRLRFWGRENVGDRDTIWSDQAFRHALEKRGSTQQITPPFEVEKPTSVDWFVVEGLEGTPAPEREKIAATVSTGPECRDDISVTVVEVAFLDVQDALHIPPWDLGLEHDDPAGVFEFSFGFASVNDDVVDRIPNTFRIRVTDARKQKAEQVKVAVSSHDEDGFKIDPRRGIGRVLVHAVSAGVFETDPLALMMDADDDEYVDASTGGVPDDTPGDRTFRAVVGGKVRARYFHRGADQGGGASTPDCEVVLPVCKDDEIKEYTIHIRILKHDGIPVVPEARVRRHFERANEVLAPCCVRLKLGSLESFEGPDEVKHVMDRAMLSAGKIEPSDEQRLVIDGQPGGRDPSRTTVFYINFFAEDQFLGDVLGETMRSDKMAAGFLEYRNAIFVASDANVTTLAHEIGHSIGFLNHADVNQKRTWNLMRSPDVGGAGVLERKRLDPGQCVQMRQGPGAP